jgi:hypothetical protein
MAGNTGSVFSFHFATIKGYHGFSGIVAGSIHAILAELPVCGSPGAAAGDEAGVRRRASWR